MNRKLFFEKNQEVLLWLANTSAGKHLIGAKQSDKIVKVSPNSFHRLEAIEKDKVILTGVFRTYENVAKELLPILIKSQIAQMPVRDEAWVEHASGIVFNNKYPQIFLDSGNYYTGAGDGRIFNSDPSYATARNATSGNTVSYTTGTDLEIRHEYYGGQYFVERVFLPIDTSSLGDNAIISAATLKTFHYNKDTTGNDDRFVIIQTTQASTSSLVLADFDNIGSIDGGQSALWSTFSTSSYTSTALNSTGLGWISLTGWTKIGIRSLRDLNNQAPSTGGRCYIEGLTSEYTGTTSDPHLVITYTLESPSPSLSPSASVSLSPSASISPSPSLSPSASHSASQSPSASPSASESRSPSASQSPSSSESPSASESPSPSLSPSASPSLSPSASPSSSESPSPSPAFYVDKYSDVGNTYVDKYSDVGNTYEDKYKQW